MAIFIAPTELRATSNLLKYISDMSYEVLPNLEALTGADVMISPGQMPIPRNDNMILAHIKGGAKLIQIKFGHDLSGSIVDGRLNEALSRMLNTGAMSWQCLLLFVGIFSRDYAKDQAIINNQLTYGQTMKWEQIQAALTFWTERGGSIDFPLSSGKMLSSHFDIHQKHIDRFTSGEDTKFLWPQIPILYNVIEPTNPHLKKWKVAQKIEVIDDLRSLIRAIPGTKIGPEKATAIFDYMKENEIRQDFLGFQEIVRTSQILEVPGIGKQTLSAIRWGLYRTLEERKRKK